MNSIIQTPTPRLQDSLDFYRRLAFKVIQETGPYLLTDGKAFIEINPDAKERLPKRESKKSPTAHWHANRLVVEAVSSHVATVQRLVLISNSYNTLA